MRTLSLCSGIGGLELAANAVLGSELVAYAEVDPDACKVMEAHWPGVFNLGDIKQVEWWGLEDHAIEMITAGYPCQPFSYAGQRKGVEDERHLWPYISEAVRVLQPQLVFLENVQGHRSKGFGEVLADLSEAGYFVSWTSLRASGIGAPHLRDRLFILATNGGSDQVWTEQVGKRGGSGSTIPVGGTEIPTDDEEFRLCPGFRYAMRDASPRTRPPIVCHQSIDWKEFGPAISRWEQCTGACCPETIAKGPRGGDLVSSRFSEWFMGYPTGWVSEVEGIGHRMAMKLCGNAVVPAQGAVALERLLDVTQTLAYERPEAA